MRKIEPVTVAIKAVISIITDEELRKKAGWIIVMCLAPIILIVSIVIISGTGTSKHNVNAVKLSFDGGFIGTKVPEEYREYIKDMQTSFRYLDTAISSAEGEMEGGDSLDDIRIKAVFYALYFGEDAPSKKNHTTFVACFYTTETRTREVTETKTVENDDGTTSEEETTTTEEYTVNIPITDLSIVYSGISSAFGIAITHENTANANEIYYLIKYGGVGNGGTFDGINSIPLSGEPFVGVDGFTVPVAGNWQSTVSSEFGPRPSFKKDPFHTGIDFGYGVPYGSDIYSALDGTVVFTKRVDNGGYGIYVMIDHGGGIVTLYAHCSELLVYDGQEVTAGQLIARVGSTGLSTGEHLHFEIRENGTAVNPRNYLPTQSSQTISIEETIVESPTNNYLEMKDNGEIQSFSI